VGITKCAFGLTRLAVYLGFKNPSVTSFMDCSEGPAVDERKAPSFLVFGSFIYDQTRFGFLNVCTVEEVEDSFSSEEVKMLS
jgi:hypothetical protein